MARGTLAFTAAFALCAAALAAPFYLNAGGGALPKIGWRCDTGAYVSGPTHKFSTARPTLATGGWRDVFPSHRWASSGDLEYKIPVPPGDHTVFLMWSETWPGASAGVRQFNVRINGELQSSPKFKGKLDVFAVTGGLDKPFFFNAGPKPAVKGFITITLERIPGKNNPFISGIALNSPNSDQIVGDEGLATCDSSSPPPAPTPTPVVIAPTPDVSRPPAPGKRCGEAQTTTGRLNGGKAFVMNVGGKAIPAISWGADNINYIVEDNVGFTATAPTPVLVPGSSWEPVYQTHRWTKGPTLTYRIPVPSGTYTVATQHAESFLSGPGQRVFDIEINGVVKKKAFDVFAAVGKNKPFYSSFPGITAVDGAITIAFKKAVENPFVNGIALFGAGSGSLAIGGPEDLNCGPHAETPTPTVTPTASPTPPVTPGCAAGTDVDMTFADTHAAHAVAGGPYVETDFDKKGYAAVALDGSNSHTHYQDDNEDSKIVTHRWTWKDATNPLADANGIVTIQKKMTTQNFPLGVTKLTLLVVDNFCNAAQVTTTITVNPSTLPGAYCYYYDFGGKALATVPIPADFMAGPKPMKGLAVGDINFGNTASFGTFKFSKNSFAVRCVFSIEVKTPGPIEYKVLHSGPVRVLHNKQLVGSSDSTAPNQMTTTTNKNFEAGLHEWQILYFRPQTLSGKLIFQFASGAVIPPSTVRHDSGATLPVISEMSKVTGASEELLFIFGTAFVNGVKVKFGNEEAQQIETSSGKIQVRAPEAPAGKVVDVTVMTQAGVSNGYKFTYTVPPTCPFPKFKLATLTNSTGDPFNIPKMAVVKYGPDGRLYVGAVNSQIYALTINKALQVTKKCAKSVFQRWQRSVLGLAFNPQSNALKLYFTTSTYTWKQNKLISDFFTGWTNGKIQSVTMNGANGCFNDDITDVVTGLPVANHDHSVQSLQFLPGGRMIVSIGGFTNGGISEPTNLLGGIWDPSLAGAFVECPTTGTAITYNDTRPEFAQVTNPEGKSCKPFATGMRNSFGMTLHTNRNLYATDNGANAGKYGNFSAGCDGSFTPAVTEQDNLLLVEEGKCHGYANLNRGRNGFPFECKFRDSRCEKPIAKIMRATTGVVEYTSNTFCDNARGNLFLSRYAAGNNGTVNRVVLGEDGKLGENGLTKHFFFHSGLAIDEGPRGELVMGRHISETSFVVLQPDYKPPTTTFFISVMPKRGPAAGGTRVMVTGHKFGTKPKAMFGANDCTNVFALDDETFFCTVPPGTVDEQVTVTVMGSTGISAGVGVDYWYF